MIDWLVADVFSTQHQQGSVEMLKVRMDMLFHMRQTRRLPEAPAVTAMLCKDLRSNGVAAEDAARFGCRPPGAQRLNAAPTRWVKRRRIEDVSSCRQSMKMASR